MNTATDTRTAYLYARILLGVSVALSLACNSAHAYLNAEKVQVMLAMGVGAIPPLILALSVEAVVFCSRHARWAWGWAAVTFAAGVGLVTGFSMSFAAIRDLGRMANMSVYTAPMLPIGIDALVITGLGMVALFRPRHDMVPAEQVRIGWWGRTMARVSLRNSVTAPALARSSNPDRDEARRVRVPLDDPDHDPVTRAVDAPVARPRQDGAPQPATCDDAVARQRGAASDDATDGPAAELPEPVARQDDGAERDAMDAGDAPADDAVTKPVARTTDAADDAVARTTDAGGDDAPTPRRLTSVPSSKLTARDAEILRRSQAGESAAEIGEALGFSKSTALRHMRRVREEAGLPPTEATA